MKVLVTGSTGFIGGRLCLALAEAGYTVRAFHRPGSSLQLLDGLPVEHFTGDLAQPESLADAMHGVEAVFHAAALMGFTSDVDKLQRITVQGTRAVFQAALKAGVRRVVHTSSVSALGIPALPSVGGVAPLPMDECHTWNCPPQYWLYGYAKYLAELEAQRAVAQGLDVVLVNPAMVFGAGDINRRDRSLVVRIPRQRILFLIEGGMNVVHIADVIKGHLLALKRGRTGERYILAGENLTFVELARRIMKVTGVSKPLLVVPTKLMHALARPAHFAQKILTLPVGSISLKLSGRHFYYHTPKAQDELGLTSPLPVEDAIAEAYAWFRQRAGLPGRQAPAG